MLLRLRKFFVLPAVVISLSFVMTHPSMAMNEEDENPSPLVLLKKELFKDNPDLEKEIEERKNDSLKPVVQYDNMDTFLTLFNISITQIPDNIVRCTSLTGIVITSTLIRELPREFGNLVNLETLSVQRNKLGKLPENFGNLVNLKEFSVKGNELIALPDSIVSCTKLETLSIAENRISKLPRRFCELVNLFSLDVAQNALNTFPNGFGAFVNLCSLYAEANQFTSIPTGIKDCKKLCKITFLDNQLPLFLNRKWEGSEEIEEFKETNTFCNHWMLAFPRWMILKGSELLPEVNLIIGRDLIDLFY